MCTQYNSFLPLNPSRKREIALLSNYLSLISVWPSNWNVSLDFDSGNKIQSNHDRPSLLSKKLKDSNNYYRRRPCAACQLFNLNMSIRSFPQSPIKLFEIWIKFSNEVNPIITISQYYIIITIILEMICSSQVEKRELTLQCFGYYRIGCCFFFKIRDLSFSPSFEVKSLFLNGKHIETINSKIIRHLSANNQKNININQRLQFEENNWKHSSVRSKSIALYFRVVYVKSNWTRQPICSPGDE